MHCGQNSDTYVPTIEDQLELASCETFITGRNRYAKQHRVLRLEKAMRKRIICTDIRKITISQ